MSSGDNNGFNMLKYVGIIAEFAEKYSTYDEITRCILLIDKLQLTITAGKIGAIAGFDEDIRKITDHPNHSDEKKNQLITEINTRIEGTEKAFDIVIEEFNFLEKVIRQKNDTPLQNMERKLDEVLLGPYYQAGKELMENAHNDFTHHINEKPLKKKNIKRQRTASVMP